MLDVVNDYFRVYGSCNKPYFFPLINPRFYLLNSLSYLKLTTDNLLLTTYNFLTSPTRHFPLTTHSPPNSYPISFLKYMPSKEICCKILVDCCTASAMVAAPDVTVSTRPPLVTIVSPSCFVPA